MEMSYLMVPIAVILRRSPIVFISPQDSAITSLQDFIGKKVRTASTGDKTLRVLMPKEGISRDQYERLYLPSDIGQFASGDVPVWEGFIIPPTNTGEHNLGRMNHDTRNAMVKTSRSQGHLEKSLTREAVSPMQFLEELYGK
jgi:ABC-type nitrate/sulfonate/bicarbonate transport system substrate-binding protein